MTSDPQILFERRGAVGLITLNRPRALNALTHAMVVAMRGRLREWAGDAAIKCVVICGSGERAFCAGGDIRALHDSGKSRTGYAADFWRDEYILNSAIKHYSKPFVALIHGICMGGGIGVSVHGAYRVASESALFAMPETGIGFFPDVGGSYFLSRCPGEIGMYLALTGARLNTADALYAHLVTHLLSEDKWPDLLEALALGDTAAEALAEMARWPLPNAPLSENRAKIDRHFSASSVEDILASLDEDGGPWAVETAAALGKHSPTSLKIAYSAVRAGQTIDFNECMRMEYRIAIRILDGHDFYEGVRAVIVDKDNNPRWEPGSLADVKDDAVKAYFASLGDRELAL